MENKVCPFCGAEISFDVKKCRFCGEWIEKNEDSMPKELKRFNWGAFLLNWIWGVMNKKYITLVYFAACLIPVIGPLAVSVWFGVKGNAWAWNSKNWDNIEAFNEAQRDWVKLWFILAGFSVIILFKVVLIFALIGHAEV